MEKIAHLGMNLFSILFSMVWKCKEQKVHSHKPAWQKLQKVPVNNERCFYFSISHLPIPVAEGDGHHEALEGVQQDIRVLVGGQEVAATRVYPDRIFRSEK